MYDIRDGYVAFCFDRAVATFGMAVEADLEDAGRDQTNAAMANAARLRALTKWLTTEDEIPKGVYADPFAR